MRVVHCHNIAGVASTLAKYQKRLGIEASVVVRHRHQFGFEEAPHGRLEGLFKIAGGDIIHYHWTSWISTLPLVGFRNPDARLMSLIGKPLVAHFHGDDLRKNLARIAFKPDHKFVSTPDLLSYTQDAEWLPNPIDCETFTPAETKPPAPLRVGYYDPPAGGVYVPSDQIARAIGQLREEGYDIGPAPARNMPHSAMPEYYRSLTIWVDKLEGGFYGLMACEAAASGVAVIASTKKVAEHMSEPAFYEFTGNLVADLRHLVENPTEIKRLSERGRTYVQKRHDPIRAAKRTIEVYESVT